MTGDDIVFLALRGATALLCFYAAWVGLRQGFGYRRATARRHRGLAGAAIMALTGVLHVQTGLVESISQAGQPIPLIHWVWLGIDPLVPIFFLMMARAFRERDALEGELARAAEHDPLTGLPNRAGFARLSQAALSGAARRGEPSVAVMFDIDHFKRVNDGWGHAAGDDVLRGVARTARAALRLEDVLGRVGGEEFALVLPGLTPEQALPLVDRLRHAVAQAVAHPGAPAQVLTFSAGIAAIEGRASEAAVTADALEAAFNAADAALYAAKGAGRDRAVIAA